ncbi:MAG: SusD/RagB family nutrient-binding outer membrane lipoprotein, partial [Carboxylicivirga sp.]|nr:SusD/RagB family nutrient-binding outer membrane lipoprotein [Carboxylicivirga sp.]
VNYIIDKAESAEGYDKQHGMALVIKSYMFSILTNLYGDVPYSQAGKGDEKSFKPAYDLQKDIYEGLIDDLIKANDLLTTEGGYPIEGDNIFDGDVLKWRKFCNSLRFKLAVLASKNRDPKPDLAEIMSDPAKYPLMDAID